MLALIALVVFVATICGVFYYWLSQRGLAAEELANPQDRRRVSLLDESVAYVGASLILAGGGIAVGQSWADFSEWGHVAIFGGAAMFFLAVGLLVLRVDETAIQRMIGMVWLISAACAGAAAGIAAHEVRDSSGAVTALVIGLTIMTWSGLLWLVRRRELQLVAMFAGLIIAVCAVIITIAGHAEPRLAIALGLWALGIGWVIVGWKYPQPLWTTVPLGTVIALAGPSLAVWDHGWVYAIAIASAAAAMAASIAVRSTLLLAAGTLALFGYISAAVIRYFHGSLGLPATLAICGVLLISLAVMIARMRTDTMLTEARRTGNGGLDPAELEAHESDPAAHEAAAHWPAAHRPAAHRPAGRDLPAGSEQPAESEPRALDLPKAS
jgi:hypothetical protein